MTWLGTNLGKRIDLRAPDPQQIEINDIATGLSHVCRFNGQLRTFYSVAEHSMHVAEMVPPEMRLAALLHDATEAYICDIPTPLKIELGDAYYAIEIRLAAAIGERFGVDLVNLPEQVKAADKILCVSERDAFTLVPQQWGPGYDGLLRYPGLRVQYAHPGDAKDHFLRDFHALYKQPRPTHCPKCKFTMSGLDHCPNCEGQAIYTTRADVVTTIIPR